ncbi:adenosine deaminase [Galactobacter sp.]|uniref:adenosine deaminase n=1 Tax=Galactobacter sp. TaxID=2676125 RepID=UPI0025C4B351|nr:adenosine deaminase [Galactobacter sp.]
MTPDDFLRSIPKAELHCHFVGAVPAQVAWDLAQRNGVELPVDGPETLYHYGHFYDFIERYMLIATAIRTVEDFDEAVYAVLEEGYRHGNVQYREMFFNPTDHALGGATYPVMLEGLRRGVARAREDFGVECKLIPSINRQHSPAAALEMVREVVANPCDEVVGIGLDASEPAGPPELFADAYRLAGEHGLKRAAHAAEDYSGIVDGPPANILTCLDLLGCDRIDHGYNMFVDPEVVERLRREQTPINVCLPGSSADLRPMRSVAIRRMIDAGLNVSLHSDDPAMHRVTPGETYVIASKILWLSLDEMVALDLAAIDAAWLDDAGKERLRTTFTEQIEALRAKVA